MGPPHVVSVAGQGITLVSSALHNLAVCHVGSVAENANTLCDKKTVHCVTGAGNRTATMLVAQQEGSVMVGPAGDPA